VIGRLFECGQSSNSFARLKTRLSLFRQYTNGKGFNCYFDGLLVGISKIFKLGLMPFGVCVICKGSECHERTSLGSSLYNPVQNGG